MSLLYFIQVFVDNQDTSLTLWIVSLISPTGFALAMDKILVLDISGQGVTLENLWHGPGIPLGGSILMMAVDILLYASLSFYLDMVIPSEHGTKQRPFFCFNRNYWIQKKVQKLPILNGESTVNSFNNNFDYQARDVEPVPREMRGREAIKIVDLYKTFNSCRRAGQVQAVNGINLTIYEGQITAILGHNGAGKSSLFNILTGLTAPSSGTAYIFGYDIRDPNDMTMIRRMTGVCPQHDILFEQLTPKEHLYFFAAIRGIPEEKIESEVKKTLKDCDLFESASDTRVKNLSGGQKRKLSVGIAIIGDPKIIILDEPTAGVDPYSRRALWQILQHRKHGKVILLTTHFMDEADILADRKAVISKGRLRCCGSSLFLKNKFGIGYHLTLVLDGNARETAITKLVNLHVPKAERARRHGRELSYILPHDAVDFFAPLFSDIELEIVSKQQCLGICSYGVSMTTLEEVFLHLETERDQEDSSSNIDNYGKKMVRNRALSRSLSLQGRSDSCISEQLDNNSKGTIRSLPESTSNNHATGLTTEKPVNEAPLIKANVNINNNNLQSKTNWIELDDIVLKATVHDIVLALLKLRLKILLRDIQRLYLMIILPLAFTAIGFYLNSIQVILPVMRSIVLDNNTYGKDINNVAIHFNNDADDTTYYDDKTFIDEFSKITNANQNYDGNYSELLNISPHIAAINFTSLTDSNISLIVLYNDTTQHSLPVILNMISNTFYRLYGNNDNQNIEMRSHPFQQTAQSQEFNIGTFSTAIFVGMVFVLIPVSLSVDMVYDREMKAKNQLRVNGLSSSLYFGAYFIVMAALMIIICAALLVMVILFDIPSFRQPAALVTLGIIIALYSPSAILCSTCFSYLFDRTDSAQSILPNILTFIGLIPFILVGFLDMLGIGKFSYIIMLSNTHLLTPNFRSESCHCTALHILLNQSNVHSLCSHLLCRSNLHYLSTQQHLC